MNNNQERKTLKESFMEKIGSDDWDTIKELILAIVIFFVMILFISYFLSSSTENEVTELSSKSLVESIESGEVKSLTFDPTAYLVSGELSNGEQFYSTFADSEYMQKLLEENKDVDYSIRPINRDGFNWGTITSLLMILLITGVFIWFVKRTQKLDGGETSSSLTASKNKPSKASKEFLVEKPDVKFSDVAGIDEAVEEVSELKEFLKEPDKFYNMGAKIPKGVLLSGSPGCGKTLLAKAVAGESGCSFYSVSGSEFVHKYVGVGADNVKKLFNAARETAPSIIFIDEIDAIGRSRSPEGNDERESTLNQLLVEMDGFDDKETVIVMAATNRPDMLDKALLRPGRFDRQITVTRPDLKGRKAILEVHSRNKKIEPNLTLDDIAKTTPGLSGAELANIMNESAILAVRRSKEFITKEEVDEALERLIAGPEKKQRIMTEKERRTIAYHECGHALVGHILEAADPVKKITIIPRGQALGYTLSMPEEDKALQSKEQMKAELAVLLGGRVAEEICNNGDVTTGASNDIQRVTKIAWEMVVNYGMSDKIGAYAYGEMANSNTKLYSEETASMIDDEVKRIVNEAHDTAFDILTKFRDRLDNVANRLLEQETIDGEEVTLLLNGEVNF